MSSQSHSQFCDVLINEYVPMDFPTIPEFIPEIPTFELQFKFQFNPVPATNAPDMSRSQYSTALAKAAFQSGIPFPAILEQPHD